MAYAKRLWSNVLVLNKNGKSKFRFKDYKEDHSDFLGGMDVKSFFWAYQEVKNPPGDIMRYGFYPCVGNIPWRKAWQLTPVFLPGESDGQRRLAGYSPWGHKESDTTEGT